MSALALQSLPRSWAAALDAGTSCGLGHRGQGLLRLTSASAALASPSLSSLGDHLCVLTAPCFCRDLSLASLGAP